MTAWEDYLTAARRLDAVRVEAAAAREADAAAAQDIRRELAVLRQRIGLQRIRLVDISRRAGLGDPQVINPTTPIEPADPPQPASAQAAAVRTARQRLDAADALLSEVDGPALSAGALGTWPPGRRNALVYGGVALVVLVLQVVLFVAAPGGAAAVLAIGCAAVLPIFGFGLSWLAVGLVFHGDGRIDRTPWLGATISAAPVVLLCAGLATAAILH